MRIVIDVDSSVPEFARPWLGFEVSSLVEQVKRAIDTGALGDGEELPSLRQLAGDLGLDGETVAKAYRLLEDEGVVRRNLLGRWLVRGAVDRLSQST